MTKTLKFAGQIYLISQPRVHLLLPRHVPGVRKGRGEGRERPVEDTTSVSPCAQVWRREKVDVVPPRIGRRHRRSGLVSTVLHAVKYFHSSIKRSDLTYLGTC